MQAKEDFFLSKLVPVIFQASYYESVTVPEVIYWDRLEAFTLHQKGTQLASFPVQQLAPSASGAVGRLYMVLFCPYFFLKNTVTCI